MEDAPCCGKFLGGPVSWSQIFAKGNGDGTETFSRIIIHANLFVISAHAHLFHLLTTLLVICYMVSQILKADSVQISGKKTARRHFQSVEFLGGPLVPRYGRGNKPLFRRSDRKSAPELDRRRRKRRRKIRSFPKGQQNSPL